MIITGYSAWSNKPKEYDTAKVFPYTYIVTCFICDDQELAVRSVFPPNWKVVKQYGYTLCSGCADKLREKMQ